MTIPASEHLLVIGIIFIALIFDFINGFHDAANAIATVVATKVLPPLYAVAMAATFNFIGPFALGVAVAETIGTGIIQPDMVDSWVILSALLGAILWDLITWWLGLPTSSSHALIGGLIGAVLCKGKHLDLVIWSGVGKVAAFMLVAPLMGFCGSLLVTIAALHICKNMPSHRVNLYFRRLQLISAALYSLSHGTNDAQKVMGIIAILLFSNGWLSYFHVPWWTIFVCALAMGIGTLFGGWRIIRTMAQRLTNLRPYQGFSAETASSLVLGGMALGGIPVSTTHVITAGIIGVGAVRTVSAVLWGVAISIVWAWILTLPMAG
ncbi:MAG: inorganic phosphate transporter, partial [Deltaproteobacteria bacterium]|nr:inorganic phosphate transporter [Deltaproteobacteria bacterium]